MAYKELDDNDNAQAIAAIAKFLGGVISSYSYHEIGGECPNCHHSPKVEKHIGVPFGGHDQESCPCRVIRMDGKSTPCGCEWTQDK